jgi:hypothetical protein
MDRLKHWAWVAWTWRPADPKTENTILAAGCMVVMFVVVLAWL